MTRICFYFQVHQPFRLRKDYDFFQIGHSPFYEDDANNRAILRKVAEKCYLPMNRLLLDMIRQWQGRFRVSFSISGVCLEQFRLYAPDVLRSFQELVATGCVELLGETYYHSLAAVYSTKEFIRQVAQHRALLKELFDYEARVFRNTELIYRDDIARLIEELGFRGIVAEGADRILGWRSPNFQYQPASCHKLGLLLKNYQLSDDIAFRFSNRDWAAWPLQAETYAAWLHQVAGNGELINLFMDYETFGEHQWAETGIFDFMRALPHQVFKHPDFSFVTPSEALQQTQAISKLSFPDYVSWADMDRDLSAWAGNALQDSSLERVYALEDRVIRLNDPEILHVWRKLQTSDHFYYMCTKWFSDGDVHKYFNPYHSPFDAHVIHNNVLSDFEARLEARRDVRPQRTREHESTL